MLGLTLLSCNPELKSEPMYEQAEVIQMVYLPDTQRTDMAPGISMSGKVVFTVVTTGHSEYWGVVFRCKDHNKTFTLAGKDIYEKVKQGQIVQLKYIEYFTTRKNQFGTLEKVILGYTTLEVIVG